MATSTRPEHWDEPEPVPGFRLLHRRRGAGAGELWEAVRAADGTDGTDGTGGRVLLRIVRLPEDEASRARAMTVAASLVGRFDPRLDEVRELVPAADGLALVRGVPAPGTTTLAALLGRRRLLRPAEVIGLGEQLGLALAALHARGISHGRLGPADVLLPPEAEAVLTGFGVAGVQGSSGLPGDDVGDLAGLLLSMLPMAGVDGEVAALRSLLSGIGELAARRRPAPEALVAALLDVGGPARVRTRPTPGRRPGVPATPVALEAAVRALRAGARADRGRARRRRRDLVRPVPVVAGSLVVIGLLGWRLGSAHPAAPQQPPAGSPGAGTAAVAPGRRWAPAPDAGTVLRLDAARAAAFATGSATGLLAADAVGSSALAADRQAMRLMAERGALARGLTAVLTSVSVVQRAPTTARLRIVDVVPPYDFVTPQGRVIARSPGHPRQRHDVLVRWSDDGWRYVEVLRPPTGTGGSPSSASKTAASKSSASKSSASKSSASKTAAPAP